MAIEDSRVLLCVGGTHAFRGIIHETGSRGRCLLVY